MNYFNLMLIIVLGCAEIQGQLRKKESATLGDRVQYLTDLSYKQPIIRLNEVIFRDHIRATPRNYSVVIMFTAMDQKRQCVICRVASEEFHIVANSYRYSSAYSNRLFFAVVDFDEGSDIFHLMKLNSAPAFIHFPPKGKPKATDSMDIQRVGFGAEAISKWIADRTDIHIRVMRPPNYNGAFLLIVIFGGIAAFLYLRRNNLDFTRFRNTKIWASSSLFFSEAMISGQMWNHIRTPPFVHRTQSGAVAYIHGSSQGQFVFETYIVCSLYVAVVAGVLLVIESGRSKGDIRKRRFIAVAGVLLYLVFFSLLLSIFRSKAHGYPYTFMFK